MEKQTVSLTALRDIYIFLSLDLNGFVCEEKVYQLQIQDWKTIQLETLWSILFHE